jgi:hypothetical protein
MTEQLPEDYSEEEALHFHVKIEMEVCVQVDPALLTTDIFHSYGDQPMPETTKQAYEQLLRACLADPHSRQRFLTTMAIERLWDLYFNEQDILSSLLPDLELVTQEGKRAELEHLVLPHLVKGAPYYWWKDSQAEEHTFIAEEAEGGLDTEPLHACIDDEIVQVSVAEITPDD